MAYESKHFRTAGYDPADAPRFATYNATDVNGSDNSIDDVTDADFWTGTSTFATNKVDSIADTPSLVGRAGVTVYCSCNDGFAIIGLRFAGDLTADEYGTSVTDGAYSGIVAANVTANKLLALPLNVAHAAANVQS